MRIELNLHPFFLSQASSTLTDYELKST
jgi:hypothetical protein